MRFPSFLKTKYDRSWTPQTSTAVLFILCLMLFAGQIHGETPDPRCVRDDLGRQVCVSGVLKRLISFAPSLTEIIFALGAENSLVGRTSRCSRPREASRIQEIGAYLNPDLERVMALRPDLVCATKTGVREELVHRLSELRIPVFVDDSRSLDDICLLLKRLGTLLGRETEADKLVQEFQKRREVIRRRIEGAVKPSVLFAVGVRPLVVAGGKSFLGALIREAGGQNIAENESIPFPRYSFEEVNKRDPDLILVLDKECRDEECLDQLRRYSTLRAVTNSRVYSMDADLMARPAPRILEGLELLAAIFHPELPRGGLH